MRQTPRQHISWRRAMLLHGVRSSGASRGVPIRAKIHRRIVSHPPSSGRAGTQGPPGLAALLQTSKGTPGLAALLQTSPPSLPGRCLDENQLAVPVGDFSEACHTELLCKACTSLKHIRRYHYSASSPKWGWPPRPPISSPQYEAWHCGSPARARLPACARVLKRDPLATKWAAAAAHPTSGRAMTLR